MICRMLPRCTTVAVLRPVDAGFGAALLRQAHKRVIPLGSMAALASPIMGAMRYKRVGAHRATRNDDE